MMRLPALIFGIIFFWMYSTNAQDSNPSFIEVSGAYGIGSNTLIYSGQIALEYKPIKTKSISYNFEYSFSKSNGGIFVNNPNSSSSYPAIAIHNSWYLNYLWHPIRSIKQPFSLLFVGVGVGYFQQHLGGQLFHYGPSVQGTLGFQYIIKDRFKIGLKSQFFYIYNLDSELPDRITHSGMPLRICLGYRF